MPLVGVKAWTFVLGLKPHLLMGTRLRRSKWLEKSQSKRSCKERVKGSSPRGPASSDLTNVSQIGFRLTWVIFQEVPAMKRYFRRVKRWSGCRNILGKSCSHRIKCTAVGFLAALMWRRPLNSIFNHYCSQKAKKAAHRTGTWVRGWMVNKWTMEMA